MLVPVYGVWQQFEHPSHFEKFVILAVRILAVKFGTNPHSLILQKLGNVEMWLLF